MTQRFVWRVFCVTEDEYVTTVSNTEPTTCPNNAGHTINATLTSIMQSEFIDVISPGYINIESQLADNQSIKIQASDPNGGIDIDAGFGGITINSTNSINIVATNASCFCIEGPGNLELDADTGTVDIDGKSGLNIGNLATTTPILIGSSANAKNITIGNTTGSSTTNIQAGTGGINLDTGSGGAVSIDATGASSNFTLNTTGDAQDLNIALLGSTNSSIILTSQGTASDAILLNTTGGITMSSTGALTMATNINSGGAISLDATANSGGISITAGNLGVGINSQFGVVGIGHFAGAQIFMGNSSTTNFIFNRWTNGIMMTHQDSETDLGTGSTTATIANLLNGIITMAPSSGINLTVPTAANAVAGVLNVQVNDSFIFSVINTDGTNVINILTNSGSTSVGNMLINALTTANFKLRFTNIGGGTEAFVIYRL